MANERMRAMAFNRQMSGESGGGNDLSSGIVGGFNAFSQADEEKKRKELLERIRMLSEGFGKQQQFVDYDNQFNPYEV